MRNFDILLVLGYFRSATAFLSIIRHMGEKLRIGILSTDADPSMKNKTGRTHDVYMQLCEEFGAQIIALGEPVQAKLMIVQQFPYPDALAQSINASVSVEKCVGLMALAMAGMEKHDNFLTQFNIRKIYVPSKLFMSFLLQHRQAEERYVGIEVEEVGLPFARHPIFPEFKVDWLIVAPTLFSFHSETGKQAFLQTVLKLLDQIPQEDAVAYKPHNGNTRDYFAPKFHYLIANMLVAFPGALLFVLRQAKKLPEWLRRHSERVLTSVFHLYVLRRAKPMSALTPYPDISLEAFLPGVRKGVIGGLSNTIWGTLYFGLPFFNCVDPASRTQSSELLPKSSESLLDLNLKFFGVPYCDGSIDRGVRGGGTVSLSEGAKDLIDALWLDLGLHREGY